MATAKISERGNGLPGVGDYVPGNDGELYIVESIDSPIHTGGPGSGNYVYATVSLADWSDCEEDAVHSSSAVVDADE